MRRAASAVAGLVVLLGGPTCAAPALWVVRDADSEIYLFGTLHALSPDARWRTRAYDAAYARADTVWFETDLESLDATALRGLIARHGVDADRTLSQKLGHRELKALKPLLAKGRVDIRQVDHLRPWAAALLLSTQPMLARGATGETGADLVMTRVTRRQTKTLRTFETLEDQVRMFASLPEPVEVAYLAEVIRDRTVPPWRRGPSLEKAWIAGDLGRLSPALVGAMRAESPAFYDALLRRRSRAWAQTLAEEMAGQGVQMVNVGALHMMGDDGLPALMRARGYEVVRVQ